MGVAGADAVVRLDDYGIADFGYELFALLLLGDKAIARSLYARHIVIALHFRL